MNKLIISLGILLLLYNSHTSMAQSLLEYQTLTNAIAATPSISGSNPNFNSWSEVIKLMSPTVSVENVLYEQPGSPYFFIHIKILNKTQQEIGVDLRDPWAVAYPNQWAPSDLAYRTVVDEEGRMPKPLDENLRQELKQAYGSQKLTPIAAGQSLDYYVNFNAGGRQVVDNAQSKYILISIKGQMFFSDGERAWDEKVSYDLFLPKPIQWRSVPEEGMVITH